MNIEIRQTSAFITWLQNIKDRRARYRTSEADGGGSGGLIMGLKTYPFDASEFLGSPESQAELIDDALDTGDASYVAHAIGVVARARGMTEVARLTGLSRESLYKALSAEGNPEFATILKVAKVLGIKITAKAV